MKAKDNKKIKEEDIEHINFSDEFSVDEEKFGNNVKLRHDTEFFKEENYILHDVIGIKRIEFTNGEEDWEIIKNKKLALTIKGSRFTKKERAKLSSPQGMNFLINGYKSGWTTVVEFKKNIKNLK